MVPAQARVALAALTVAALCASPASAIRLCMLPAGLPFPEEDERRAQLEQLVTRHFTEASIEIAPSREVSALLEQVDERSGAIFDPLTGRVVAEKDEALRMDIEKSMREAFGCSGFVSVRLEAVKAYYDGVSANWDGQRVQVNSGGRIAGRVAASVLLGAYITETGWVPALSLWIRVTDLRQRDVAFRSAGVEPLMDFSYSRGEDLLPEDRWLRDPERIEYALGSALGADLALLKAAGPGATGTDEGAFRWE